MKNIATVLLFLSVLFGTDYMLFDGYGYMELRGAGTQEGQVVKKRALAERLAPYADIILFGSSMTRSGLASVSFLRRGIVPLNFAVSAGGPVYSYYALDSIREIVARRERKPVVALELNREYLMDGTSEQSEYPQVLTLVRSRAVQARDIFSLYPLFYSYGIGKRFLKGIVFPSSYYRSHGMSVLAHWNLGKDFSGFEDGFGFSPLYSIIGSAALADMKLADRSLNAYKMSYLEKFIALCHELGCPVVLYPAPYEVLLSSPDISEMVENVVAKVFPELPVVKKGSFSFEYSDFAGKHLNMAGSEKYANQLVDILRLSTDGDEFSSKIGKIYEVTDLPDFTQWNVILGAGTLQEGNRRLDVSTPPSSTSTVLESNLIKIRPGKEYVLYFPASIHSNELTCTISSFNKDGTQDAYSVLSASFSKSSTFLVRFTARTEYIKVGFAYDNSRVGRFTFGEPFLVCL